MKIRKAIQKDVSSLSRLVASLSKYYLTSDKSKLPNWFIASIKPSSFANRILSDEFTCYVAEEGEVIGYIALKGKDHLYHLFVDESHQRQGVASALWSHLLSEIDLEGCKLRSSLIAVPFYKSLGFTEINTPEIKSGFSYQAMEWKSSSIEYC